MVVCVLVDGLGDGVEVDCVTVTPYLLGRLPALYFVGVTDDSGADLGRPLQLGL